MALYALEAVDDALDVTRSFLTGIDRAAWAKLAAVALFVGGPTASGFSVGGGNGGAPAGEVPVDELSTRVWLVIAAVVTVVALVGLAVLLLGSILEFVFVESLRNEAVTVRRYWGRHWRRGVRLFGFRLALALFVLAGMVLLAAPVVLPLVGVGPFGGGFSVLALLVVLPVFVVLAVVGALIHSFTTVFVVPVMIVEEVGVLAGWRRLWPTIAADWKQYLAYAVASLLLSIGGGVLVAIAVAIGALVLLVPFAILFGVGFVSFAFVFEPLGIALFVVFGLLFALALVALVALVQLPVKTYLRYYALLVLGDVEPAFDLIPEQRAAVRGESSAEAG